jgi:hypothetical protein
MFDFAHLLSDLNESPTVNATRKPSDDICASSTVLNERTSSGVRRRLLDMGGSSMKAGKNLISLAKGGDRTSGLTV